MDRSELAVQAAALSTVGYAVPLVIGLATGRVGDGVTASAGALIVGFANLGGRYRIRAATLLATALAAGVACLFGGLAGPSVIATVVLIGGWGFAGGLLVAFGTRSALVAMLSTWALLLAGDLNLHGEAVLHEAWLITAGGLTQTLIVVAVWPTRRFAAERHAVADAYRALADYARAPHEAALPQLAAALSAAADTVGTGLAIAGERGTLWTMVEQGEWIRLELAALSRSDHPGVDTIRKAAADTLDAIAAARSPEPSLVELQRNVREIHEPAVRRQATSLLAWVTAAAHESPTGVPLAAPESHALPDLQAELTLRSSAFRHAIRLSLALIVAAIVYRGLSLGAGYWVPLTVLFVLKPDYGTTISRALGRSAGTLAGVTIAWAIVTPFSAPDAVIVASLVVLACLAYTLYTANYTLFSIVLTVLIALLVEFSGGSPVGALIDRIIDTTAGTAIALAAVALWPTRETPQTLEALAAYVAAERRWIDAILDAYASGGHPESLRSTRLAARRARTHARDAVGLALGEPPRRRPDARPLHDVLGTMEQLSESALILTAAVQDGSCTPSPALTAYRARLDVGLNDIASALRHGAWPTGALPERATPHLDNANTPPCPATLESARMLAALNRLHQTWQQPIHRPSEPPAPGAGSR